MSTKAPKIIPTKMTARIAATLFFGAGSIVSGGAAQFPTTVDWGGEFTEAMRSMYA